MPTNECKVKNLNENIQKNILKIIFTRGQRRRKKQNRKLWTRKNGCKDQKTTKKTLKHK